MSRLSVLVLMVAAVTGCDDDDRTEREAQITRAAYDAVCGEAREMLLDQYSGSYYVQALCTAAAVEGNDDVTACGNALEACIEDPPASIQAGADAILAQAGCPAISIDPSACSSTVGRLKDCLEDLDEAVGDLKYPLTCAAVGQTMPSWDVLALPESCRTLESDC